MYKFFYSKGFTFVEIFISLFIVGLISTLVIPRYLDSKSTLALKTQSEELSEYFFLTQHTAASLGLTLNVTINSNEDNSNFINSFSFFLPHIHTSLIQEDIIKFSNFVTCSLSTPITSIEFYPDKSWGLFLNSNSIPASAFHILVSFKSTEYIIQFFSHSSSIQLIKPG